MKKLLLILSLPLAAVSAKADVVVVQAGQMFLNADAQGKAEEIKTDPSTGKSLQMKTLKIKKGESITFKNMDKVTHNAYSEGFDLKAQPPGDSRSQVFEKDGKYTIRCAIHPKMKFDVEVAN